MFRDAFKYYKSRNPPPDLSNVIDFATHTSSDIIEVPTTKQDDLAWLTPTDTWKVYALKNKNGLIVIKNPFTPIGQRYWAVRCLKDFTKKPQKLNIDPHDYLSENEDWWETSEERTDLLKKLRWATLGYHHNWDTKVYSDDNKDEFPNDLRQLSEYVASAIGFAGFKSQAAIINYYHMNSTLSGHTDHSEVNLDAPLLSFSFGQSAIFLIGGITEDIPAIPLYIHSGDVVIMSKESRLCYHAVPKILTAIDQPWNSCNKSTNDEFFKRFNDYLQESRINMNVRQVLNDDQSKLCTL